MKKIRRFAVVVMVATLGCSDAADRSPDPLPEAPDSVAPSAVQTPAQTCGVADGTFLTADGIGRLRIGAELSSIRGECAVVRDTTGADNEGMQQRRIAVDLGRDTVEAVIVDGRVWRIHVAGPGFRTGDDLGVGTRVAELRAGRTARVLAGEGAMFVTLAGQCGLSFKLAGVEFGPERPASELPANARVVEVLAFGCAQARP